MKNDTKQIENLPGMEHMKQKLTKTQKEVLERLKKEGSDMDEDILIEWIKNHYPDSKNVKIKEKVGKIEISISFPNTKDGIKAIKNLLKKIIPSDTCKWCGGELESWGSKEAICKDCGRKQ